RLCRRWPHTTVAHYHVHAVLLLLHVPAPSELSALSLHDALPISLNAPPAPGADVIAAPSPSVDQACPAPAPRKSYPWCSRTIREDRKSTRLNSSHLGISYAVFCLKKKTKASTPWRPLHDTTSQRR